MSIKEVAKNSIVRSGVKAVKYPTFALVVPLIVEVLEKITDIQMTIPWLDNLLATGVLWTVAGFIFVYDVLKHTFGWSLP